MSPLETIKVALLHETQMRLRALCLYKEETTMSEQICQGCGKPKSSCTCIVDEAIQTIVVKHEGLPKDLKGNKGSDDELEATKAKLEQRNETLKIIALKKLENDVKKWASVVPDEKKREAIINSIMNDDDPLGNFKRKKEMLSIMRQALEVGGVGVSNDDDVETPPPAGDGRGPPAKRVLQSGLAQISKIYDVLDNKSSSDEQKARARRKADQLVDQFIKGRQKAIREDPKHEYYVGFFMCPKCDKRIPARRGAKRATKCPHCNATLTRRVE